MGLTKIEWTATLLPDGASVPGYTFNPVRGCQKISPGCANCYAETQSKRNPAVLGEWGPDGKRVVAAESYWRQPLLWDRMARDGICPHCHGKSRRDTPGRCECCVGTGRVEPYRARVFCASLSDVFEDHADWLAPRVRLYHLIQETPHMDWLLLTKRPENIRRFHGGDGVPRSWSETMPRNVWLGVSVEDQQRADERIPTLLATPAAVRFLSVEPLLGPVDLAPYLADFDLGQESSWGNLHWVIIGGESGPGARPCHLDWVRALIRQCAEARAACFVKQVGAVAIENDDEEGQDAGPARLLTIDRKGGSMDEWPIDLRVRQFPEVRHV